MVDEFLRVSIFTFYSLQKNKQSLQTGLYSISNWENWWGKLSCKATVSLVFFVFVTLMLTVFALVFLKEWINLETGTSYVFLHTVLHTETAEVFYTIWGFHLYFFERTINIKLHFHRLFCFAFLEKRSYSMSYSSIAILLVFD